MVLPEPDPLKRMHHDGFSTGGNRPDSLLRNDDTSDPLKRRRESLMDVVKEEKRVFAPKDKKDLRPTEAVSKENLPKVMTEIKRAGHLDPHQIRQIETILKKKRQ